MSLASRSTGKKWVDIFDERVEYKIQTKTYRISNQKFNHKHPRKTSQLLPMENSLELTRSMSGLHHASSVSLSSRLSSPKLFPEDSMSILTEGSANTFQRKSQMDDLSRKFLPLKDCKHTAENLHPPPTQLDWNPSWGSQLLCYVCCEPAINDATMCKKCNMVAHFLCLNNPANEDDGFHLPPIKMSNTRQSFFGKSYKDVNTAHRCPNCEETFTADMHYYEQLIMKIKEERQRELCATLIGYRALIFIYRCRMSKKKKALVKIQAYFRGILTRKSLMPLLSKQQKTVVLQFTHLPSCIVGSNKDLATMSTNSNSVTAVPLMPECLIIIAVHDTFKNMQLFRYDKTVENLLAGEMILIPGICLYHTLLITIGMKDSGTGNGVYTLIGQAQLQIRDIGKRTKKSSEITLNFLERISVIDCFISFFMTCFDSPCLFFLFFI
jgi:hypothetical protein